MLPIPGLISKEAKPAAEEPIMFIAEAFDAQTLTWHGQHFEFFYSQECPDTIAAGDRIEAIFVPETQQIWVIGKVV